jgi:dipeptidyl aminopeptidase/acylaminoacyl peptidase
MIRKFMLAFAAALSTLLASVPGQAQNAAAKQIPVESLFRKAEFGQVSLSPNEKLLAAVAPRNGRFNLVIVDLEKRSLNRLTNIDNTDINTFFWLSNERIIFSTADRQGFETRGDGGIYAVNIDGTEGRELSKPIRAKLVEGARVLRTVNPLGRVRGSKDEIYVQSNERSADTLDLYKMNTKTGKKTLLTFDSPGKVRRWVFDKDMIPRAALSDDSDAQKGTFYYRDSEGAPWQKMYEWDALADEINPQFFDKNNKLYVASNVGRNTMGLFEYDLAGKKLGKLVYADDTYDLTGPTVWGGGRIAARFGDEDADDQIIGISYNADKPKTVWFDEKYANVQAQLEKAFPGANPRFGVLKEKMLVTVTSDRDPGAVYLFDRSKPSVTELLRFADWIKPAEMAEMRPIKFTARDGVEIHGYLTLPQTFEKGKPVPLVVHPHGGPWARDGWGFNREVQFMANRGYAVLQVNFRNSTGYGSKILRGGYKQWGEKSQDDILDGLLWTIKEGYADKDRIGVYGASYGGYSTLMQLVRSPEIYKWGINYVGVTDMFVHQQTQPAQKLGNFGDLAKRSNGDAKADREMFERTSPTLHVRKIRAPVLHAYGGEDLNVDIANGNAIKNAFSSAGLPVDYIFVAEEAHGYREDKNVFMFYNRFDEFMKKNTPGK